MLSTSKASLNTTTTAVKKTVVIQKNITTCQLTYAEALAFEQIISKLKNQPFDLFTYQKNAVFYADIECKIENAKSLGEITKLLDAMFASNLCPSTRILNKTIRQLGILNLSGEVSKLYHAMVKKKNPINGSNFMDKATYSQAIIAAGLTKQLGLAKEIFSNIGAKTARDYVVMMDIAIENGDFDYVETLYKKTIAMDIVDSDIHRGMLDAFLFQNKFAKAENFYRKFEESFLKPEEKIKNGKHIFDLHGCTYGEGYEFIKNLLLQLPADDQLKKYSFMYGRGSHSKRHIENQHPLKFAVMEFLKTTSDSYAQFKEASAFTGGASVFVEIKANTRVKYNDKVAKVVVQAPEAILAPEPDPVPVPVKQEPKIDPALADIAKLEKELKNATDTAKKIGLCQELAKKCEAMNDVKNVRKYLKKSRTLEKTLTKEISVKKNDIAVFNTAKIQTNLDTKVNMTPAIQPPQPPAQPIEKENQLPAKAAEPAQQQASMIRRFGTFAIPVAVASVGIGAMILSSAIRNSN